MMARRFMLVASILLVAAMLLAGCGTLVPSPGKDAAPNSGQTQQPGDTVQTPDGQAGTGSGDASNEATLPIKVYFTRYASPTAPAEFVAVTRQVPRSQVSIRAALEELLKGPTAEEKAAGLSSWFSDQTVGMVRGVNLKDGRAIVDFDDLSKVIPNASTSEGSHILLGQLGATIAQFTNVKEIEYRINGDNNLFMGWLQRGPGAVSTDISTIWQNQ